ncbi:hypothetical protein D5272_03270 [bacterium D16-76]|nr:hypothetical protein [bacterium D16-76]
MKKVLAGIVSAALVISVASTSALAGGHHAWAIDRITSGISMGRTCHGFGGWVDTNGDGVCDNYDPSLCPGNGQGWNNGGCWGNGGQGNGWGNGGHHGGGHHGGHC